MSDLRPGMASSDAYSERHATVAFRNSTTRLAGFLYFLVIATGIFSLLYVPSRLEVHGDAAATVRNIVASESLFRLGIAVGAISYVLFLVLPLVLYRLLSHVNRDVAVLMVVFAVTCIPIDLVAIANQLDILSLVGDEKYAASPEQLNAAVMLLLDASHDKILISEIFWGLWLLPFGYLVFKSGFLPRILGIALMLGCFSYLATFFAETLFPRYTLMDFVMWPASVGEIGICLWMLVIGARFKRHA